MKSLYIEPYGGIGNRFRVMNAAYGLSRDYGCRLIIVWTDSPDCACKYEDLFELRNDVGVINRTIRHDMMSRLKRKAGSYFYPERVSSNERLPDNVYCDPAVEGDDVLKEFSDFMATRQRAYLRACTMPYKYEMDHFSFSKKLYEEADKVISEELYPDRSCGDIDPEEAGFDAIHIRGTDLPESIGAFSEDILGKLVDGSKGGGRDSTGLPLMMLQLWNDLSTDIPIYTLFITGCMDGIPGSP